MDVFQDTVEYTHVIEYDGKFWGVQYEDGRSTEYGWGPYIKADHVDPRFCKKPEDNTYRGSHHVRELRKGRVIKVRVETKVSLASDARV